jgi:hypothetical protein
MNPQKHLAFLLIIMHLGFWAASMLTFRKFSLFSHNTMIVTFIVVQRRYQVVYINKQIS